MISPAYKFLLLMLLAIAAHGTTARAGDERIDLTFSGGYDTEGQDRGRPVVLVAGALGVPPEVFREAFKLVHPAGPDSGGPTDAEARQNKAVLLGALGKYGVTDEALNRASNRYRYRREKGEIWPTSPAAGYAIVRDGKVVSAVVVKGGFGYSSTPVVNVPNHPETAIRATLGFDKDFAKNGTVTALAVDPATH